MTDTPPIDVLAVAAERLSAAVAELASTRALNSGPAAYVAQAVAETRVVLANSDLCAAREYALEIAAAQNCIWPEECLF